MVKFSNDAKQFIFKVGKTSKGSQTEWGSDTPSLIERHKICTCIWKDSSYWNFLKKDAPDTCNPIASSVIDFIEVDLLGDHCGCSDWYVERRSRLPWHLSTTAAATSTMTCSTGPSTSTSRVKKDHQQVTKHF